MDLWKRGTPRKTVYEEAAIALENAEITDLTVRKYLIDAIPLDLMSSLALGLLGTQ